MAVFEKYNHKYVKYIDRLATSISSGIGITPKGKYTKQIFAVFDKCNHENVKNWFVYVELKAVYVKLNVEYVNKYAPYVEKCKHST